VCARRTRYRDLIDSADSVIAMKTAAEGLAGCFERLDHHTARLLAHLRKPGPTATTANGTPLRARAVARVSCVCACV
jgi:hypothetical protein